jgi:hypothetical protein
MINSKRDRENTHQNQAADLGEEELSLTSGGFFIAAGFGCAPVVAARPVVAAYPGVVVY